MSPRLFLAPQLRLGQLLPQARFVHARDIAFRGFECSAELCGAEDLLVLVEDESQPAAAGHLPAPDQVAGVLSQRELPHWPGPQCVVPDVWQALGQVAQAVAGWPARSLQLVGVWGTGLTSAAAQLVHRVLGTSGIATGLVSSALGHDGHHPYQVDGSRFRSPQMAQWLARIHEGGCTHAVLQVPGSHAPSKTLAGLELDVLCITRADEHAEWALQALEHLRPEGVLIVAAENAAARAVLDHWDGPALTVGLGEQWEVGATVLEEHPGEQTFLIHAGWETVPVRTRWLGSDYVRACLLATAVGLVHQFRLPMIARGLETLDGVPGCMETVALGQEFPVVLLWPEAARCPSVLQAWQRAVRGTVHRVRWTPEPVASSAVGEDSPLLPLAGATHFHTATTWDELAHVLCQAAEGEAVLIELPDGITPEQVERLRQRIAEWASSAPRLRIAA